MSIKTVDIWDAVNDDISIAESGQLSETSFNIRLKRTQINLLRFLTGDLVDNQLFPIPYKKQKLKDYLKDFIVRPFNNSFELPEDYYNWDNLYKLGRVLSDDDCNVDDIEIDDSCDTKIELLDGQQFNERCSSWIKELRPSEGEPIGKIVDNRVETLPKDVGTMALEYIRYPKDAEIKLIIDPNTNDEIVDVNASGEVEWGKWALEYLVWGIVNYHSKKTREGALKQFNKSDEPKG
jgi:hypothetical protein